MLEYRKYHGIDSERKKKHQTPLLTMLIFKLPTESSRFSLSPHSFSFFHFLLIKLVEKNYRLVYLKDENDECSY